MHKRRVLQVIQQDRGFRKRKAVSAEKNRRGASKEGLSHATFAKDVLRVRQEMH
jgi:hypothetical protein